MWISGLILTGFLVAMLRIIIPAATNCLTLISWSRFTARESIRRVNHTSVFAIIFVVIIRNNIFVFWSAKETSKKLPQAISSGYLDFNLSLFSFWNKRLFQADFSTLIIKTLIFIGCSITCIHACIFAVLLLVAGNTRYNQIMVPVIFLDYRLITLFLTVTFTITRSRNCIKLWKRERQRGHNLWCTWSHSCINVIHSNYMNSKNGMKWYETEFNGIEHGYNKIEVNSK